MPRSRLVTRWFAPALAGLAVVVGGLTAGAPTAAPAPQEVSDGLDRLFAAYWKADDAGEAERAGARIAASGAGFDEVLERLEAGRTYATDVRRGEVRWMNRAGPDLDLATIILVPKDYDPVHAYPVRVQLHGGVGRTGPAARRRFRPLESTRATIHVLPSGFAGAQWWFANQVRNLAWVLGRLKRVYHVDENRVHLLGVSDGGTGAYFLALKDTTPWASFVALNGSPRVLANPSVRADGDLHMGNLVNKPLFVVNGGRDPLYPVHSVVPYLEAFRGAGARLVFRPREQAGHDTSWWDDERIAIDEFVDDSPRDPLPDRLSWEADRSDRYTRAHWLVITEIDGAVEGAGLEDANEIQPLQIIDFGMRVDSRVDEGRRIVDVVRASAAERMGLRKGDVVLAIDGVPVRSAEESLAVMRRHEEAAPLEFRVDRRGVEMTLTVPFPPATDALPPERAFPRRRPSGRVDLARVGNRVEARTRGIARFTLLLSPRQFDFDQPIVVVVNGREVVRRIVERDLATLLRWAARDDDRTMLFGAELEIDVRPASTR